MKGIVSKKTSMIWIKGKEKTTGAPTAKVRQEAQVEVTVTKE